MSKTRGIALVVPAVAVAMLVPNHGCGGPCDKIVGFEAECGKGKGMPEERRLRLISDCEGELSSGTPRRGLSNRVACVEEVSDCAAYQTCLQDRRIAWRIEEINTYVGKGEPRDALLHCGALQDRIADYPELEKACISAASAALDSYARRDASFRIASTCRETWVKKVAALDKRCAEAFQMALQRAITDGKYYDLKHDCSGDFATKSENAKKVCAEVLGKAQTRLAADLTAVRDGKADKKQLWTKCSNLKTVGEALGVSHKRDAERLCKEAEAGANLGEALEKVDDELKKERKNLPLACASAMKRVQELVPSAWQKQARAALVTHCYEDLAAKILADELPSMEYCVYPVKKVLEAVDRYKIKHPKLDDQVAAARKKCKN